MKYTELNKEQLVNVAGGFNWGGTALCSVALTGAEYVVGGVAGGLIAAHYSPLLCAGAFAW